MPAQPFACGECHMILADKVDHALDAPPPESPPTGKVSSSSCNLSAQKLRSACRSANLGSTP